MVTRKNISFLLLLLLLLLLLFCYVGREYATTFWSAVVCSSSRLVCTLTLLLLLLLLLQISLCYFGESMALVFIKKDAEQRLYLCVVLDLQTWKSGWTFICLLIRHSLLEPKKIIFFLCLMTNTKCCCAKYSSE